MKKVRAILRKGSMKAVAAAAGVLSTVQAHAAFVAPAGATTAAADVGEAIDWAIGIGWTLAAASVIGVVSIGLFKKYVKKGAS